MAKKPPKGRLAYLEWLCSELEAAIQRKEVILWVHMTDGSSVMLDAVSTAMNGDAIQVEAEPWTTFDSYTEQTEH